MSVNRRTFLRNAAGVSAAALASAVGNANPQVEPTAAVLPQPETRRTTFICC